MGPMALCLLAALCLGLARAEVKTVKLGGFDVGAHVIVKGKYFPKANLNAGRFMDFSLLDKNGRAVYHLIWIYGDLEAATQDAAGKWTFNRDTYTGYRPSAGDKFKLAVWFSDHNNNNWDTYMNDQRAFAPVHSQAATFVDSMIMNTGAVGEITEIAYFPPHCTWTPGNTEPGAANNRPDTYRAVLLAAKWANESYLNTINDNEERVLIAQRLAAATSNTEAELEQLTPCAFLEAANMYIILRDTTWMNQTELAAKQRG